MWKDWIRKWHVLGLWNRFTSPELWNWVSLFPNLSKLQGSSELVDSIPFLDTQASRVLELWSCVGNLHVAQPNLTSFEFRPTKLNFGSSVWFNVLNLLWRVEGLIPTFELQLIICPHKMKILLNYKVRALDRAGLWLTLLGQFGISLIETL